MRRTLTVKAIRLYGDPVLTTRAGEITEFDESLEKLTEDMLETMDDAGGVGLAANQIGPLKRIFVYDCSSVETGMRGVIINPVWEAVGDKTQAGNEGCLSIPDISMSTERFETVSVSGKDVHGNPVSMVVSGLMARCVQHETDHLDGVLFLQRLETDDRKQAMAQIRNSDWFNQ